MKKNMKKLIGILVGTLLLFSNIGNLSAASGSISVSSGTSKIVVGKSFNVTIKLSSSYALGTWEWTVDYDKNKFKLTSGESNVVGYGDGSKKSVSYSYTFKAIGSGSGKISVKSYSALNYSDKSELSLSVSSKSVNVITQAQLEASYSKNNNLKSLGVSGYTLTPSFNKDTLEYSVSVGSNTEKVKLEASKEDSRSSISGIGEVNVAEGDNKFNVIVTAENGSTKTYVVTVTVKDNNPIEVDIDNKKLTVVKRASSLTSPENFEAKEITINDINVPGFYSEINDYNLIGLKDEEGVIELYIYKEKEKTYTLYSETKLNQLLLQPLEMDKDFDKNVYKKGTTIINDTVFESYKLLNTKHSIIHAKNLTNGENDYYMYDASNNTVIKYLDDEVNVYKNKSDKYFKIIVLLCGETVLVLIILLIMLVRSVIKKNKKKRINNIKDNNKEEIKEETKEEIKEKIKEKIKKEERIEKNDTEEIPDDIILDETLIRKRKKRIKSRKKT